jgi:hypothetical protein
MVSLSLFFCKIRLDVYGNELKIEKVFAPSFAVLVTNVRQMPSLPSAPQHHRNTTSLYFLLFNIPVQEFDGQQYSVFF